jgi:hypothetical protein
MPSQNNSRDEGEIARLVGQWSVSEAEARGMLTLIQAGKDELGDARAGIGNGDDEAA